MHVRLLLYMEPYNNPKVFGAFWLNTFGGNPFSSLSFWLNEGLTHFSSAAVLLLCFVFSYTSVAVRLGAAFSFLLFLLILALVNLCIVCLWVVGLSRGAVILCIIVRGSHHSLTMAKPVLSKNITALIMLLFCVMVLCCGTTWTSTRISFLTFLAFVNHCIHHIWCAGWFVSLLSSNLQRKRLDVITRLLDNRPCGFAGLL